MKNKKSKSFNHRKSIAGLVLASILTFSFNYMPISVVSRKVASAYKSSNTASNTFYGNTSSSTESKIDTEAKVPKSLEQYFEGSSANFNIETFYRENFYKEFESIAHNFLKNANIQISGQGSNFSYNSEYEAYLDFIGCETIGEYYEKEKNSSLSTYSTFIQYFEHFVTTDTKWNNPKDTNAEHTLPAIFTEKILNKFTQPFIYQAIARYLITTGEAVEGSDISGDDGLTSDSDDVYEKSLQYKRVKDYIDKGLSARIAIYSYDGKTQNNYVAGIIANGAPISSSYYYESGNGAYEINDHPDDVTYVTSTIIDDDRVQYKNVVYYSTIAKADLDAALNSGASPANSYKTYGKYFNETSIASDLTNNPLSYKLLSEGEEGYIGTVSGIYYPVFVKYQSNPYTKPATNSPYFDLYVVDDSPTEERLATYNSLQYITVITSDELDKDMWLDPVNKTGLNPDRLYINVPYSESADLGGSSYFDKLFSELNSSDNSYVDNLIEILTNNGESKVYLKYKTKAANNKDKIVYVDKNDIPSGKTVSDYFKSTYSYVVKEFDSDETGFNINDYYKIDNNSYSTYLSNFTGDFPLYFKKVKVYYEKLVTDETDTDVYPKNGGSYVYETVSEPNVKFETKAVPSTDYENFDGFDVRKLYVISDSDVEVVINSQNFVATKISKDDLSSDANRGYFVKVPAAVAKSLSPDKELEFYYKHSVNQDARAIYIIDNSDGAKNNEVYKNLHYNVIKQSDYDSDYANYVLIESNDPNYNENFKNILYYKYDSTTPANELFVQNEVTKSNAIYVLDTNGASPTEKPTYYRNQFTVIDSNEYNSNKEFYIELSETERKELSYTGSNRLFYKYQPTNSSSRRIYIYSNKTDDDYSTFYETDEGYVANDYELIQKGDENYVAGKELYYKRKRNTVYERYNEKTYYYYQNKTANNISAKANSYYAISFYAYTNGKITTTTGTENLAASFYITDTTGTISEIVISDISTNGEWKQYYAFIQTDPSTASTLQLSMSLGDKESIAGKFKETATSVSGIVLFDDIRITLINETDFTKQSIDDKSIFYKAPASEGGSSEGDSSEGSSETETPAAPKYEFADSYGNQVIAKQYPITFVNNNAISGWTDIFDFDAHEDYFIDGDPKESVLQKDIEEYFANYENDKKNPDYLKYDSFEDGFWHYYVKRYVQGQDTEIEFRDTIESYLDGKANISVVYENTINKTPSTEDDDDDDKDETDITSVSDTFKEDNKVLKIENKDRIRSLGAVSKPFKIEQNSYYKISIWVYSPEKDATATIKAESRIFDANSPKEGGLYSTSATVNANLQDYTTTPKNEYGWIEISFFIEGNAYGDEEVTLALLADKNQTIYFDNISVQKVTNKAYTDANSDSDSTTYCLSLSPSSMLMTNGITNGEFASVKVTDNYKETDYTLPREAQNWSLSSGNSSQVIAGAVPTSKEYLEHTNNFYTKYNGNGVSTYYPFDKDEEVRNNSNLFAIHFPKSITSPLEGAGDTEYLTSGNYKIYSSLISLTANKTFEISFDFISGFEFDGTMVAKIYAGSVNQNRVIASIEANYSSRTTEWDTYTFIIQTGISSQSVYLEIGVEDAVGTCFFKNAKKVDSSYSSINEAKDSISDNEKLDISNYDFANLSTINGSIHGEENENGVFETTEYNTNLNNSKSYTVGKSGVVVASFYEKKTTADYYTVKYTDKITYYIKKVAGEEEAEASYKLYSDSILTKEVERIDGKKFKIVESSNGEKLTLLVGNSEKPYEAVAVNKTDYTYHFEDGASIGDIIISEDELKNNISENLFIIANSNTTGYSRYSSVYTKTLSGSSYYVLKIYVKTSDIIALNSGSEAGLNINISAISTSWSNINTTSKATEENNGFVCYQVLISTNSSISNFGVDFSLGSDKNPCKGYAAIAGVEIESFASEELFNEYASTLDEDDTTIKRYYAEKSSNEEEEEPKDEVGTSWSTFFYIFSSLLLALVTVIALVAIFIKKHPIKRNKAKANDAIILTDAETPNKKSKKAKTEKAKTETEVNKTEGDDGFV